MHRRKISRAKLTGANDAAQIARTRLANDHISGSLSIIGWNLSRLTRRPGARRSITVGPRRTEISMPGTDKRVTRNEVDTRDD